MDTVTFRIKEDQSHPTIAETADTFGPAWSELAHLMAEYGAYLRLKGRLPPEETTEAPKPEVC